MFLSALILASKYLQDRNYSSRAWSKISGVNKDEINTNEFLFLNAIDWRLYFNVDLFERWTDTILLLLPEGISRNWFDPDFKTALKWIILRIKPDLSNSEDIMIPIAQTFRESKRKNPWAAEEIVILQKKRAQDPSRPAGRLHERCLKGGWSQQESKAELWEHADSMRMQNIDSKTTQQVMPATPKSNEVTADSTDEVDITSNHALAVTLDELATRRAVDGQGGALSL